MVGGGETRVQIAEKWPTSALKSVHKGPKNRLGLQEGGVTWEQLGKGKAGDKDKRLVTSTESPAEVGTHEFLV